MLASHIKALAEVLNVSLPIQLFDNKTEKTEDGPHLWAFTTHMGDLDGVPGSWLQFITTQAFEGIFLTNQWVDNCFLFLSFVLPFKLKKIQKDWKVEKRMYISKSSWNWEKNRVSDALCRSLLCFTHPRVEPEKACNLEAPMEMGKDAYFFLETETFRQ